MMRTPFLIRPLFSLTALLSAFIIPDASAKGGKISLSVFAGLQTPYQLTYASNETTKNMSLWDRTTGIGLGVNAGVSLLAFDRLIVDLIYSSYTAYVDDPTTTSVNADDIENSNTQLMIPIMWSRSLPYGRGAAGIFYAAPLNSSSVEDFGLSFLWRAESAKHPFYAQLRALLSFAFDTYDRSNNSWQAEVGFRFY